MTILPKKKVQKDKNEVENRDPPRSPGETRATHVSRRQGSPPPARWNSPAPIDDRNLDACGRFEELHTHDPGSSHNKRRHRSSPHRTSRKHRHTAHQSHTERQSTRQERQVTRPVWVEPTPGTSHSSHSPHIGYNESPERCLSVTNNEEGYNSEDEYTSSQPVIPQLGPNVSAEELERCFEATLTEKRGFLIKQMGEDGACMFRSVADQIYGDQEMHSIVRRNCVDYMAKNSDFYSQYITEDFHSYLNRKRMENCHGNHIEMQALCELYNRPIEVYQYSIDPINTFHGAYKAGNEPIRLSYHGNHYNSVVDPKKATIGVGLGLPGFQPGLAERNLMSDAKQVSEDFHIEQTMLEDKMRETDWEVTQESIEEQVARESYLQWLRDQEKRGKAHEHGKSASAACSSSSSSTSADPAYMANMTASPNQRSPEPRTARSPRHKSSASNSTQNSPMRPDITATQHPAEMMTITPGAPLSPKASTSESLGAVGGVAANFCETESIMNRFSPAMYGLADWDEDNIMAQVIARSQQEYMDRLKKQSTHKTVMSSPCAASTSHAPSTSVTLEMDTDVTMVAAGSYDPQADETQS